MNNIAQDPIIFKAIQNELQRQREGIELIPSENYVSVAVLEALGSILTNKYAEGYPGKRYYGGTQYVDVVEQLAIDRVKKLFGAEHANVQPLSGAPANMAAYAAILNIGDTVLGMDLAHGGHLTHGHPVTMSAKLYKFIRYTTHPKTGKIDYDEIASLAAKHHPKLILVGYSAYTRDIDYKTIKAIADQNGAMTMADIAHIAGLICCDEMNNPTPDFDIVTSTTHKTLRGPRGGLILCKQTLAPAIDKAVFPHLQGGPHENVIAAKAVAFGEALEPSFRAYAQQIKKNAKAFESVFLAEAIPLCFGGTENHLLLIDVSPFGITGKKAQEVLDEVSITCNKNMIPNDPRSPMDPSGIRIGTPAITSRGFQESHCEQVARWILHVLRNPNNAEIKSKIRKEVHELTNTFPLYPTL